MSGWDALNEEAREKLAAWPVKARELFKELLEDAPSEMQRELLQRAVAAGHSPPEIHAFADELRGLEDDEAFDACTLDVDAPQDYTVVQLLRAEADPLYAFELKGHSLSPSDDGEEASPGSPTQELESLPYVPPSARKSAPSFDSGRDPATPRGMPISAEGSDTRHKRLNLNDLGDSVDAMPRARPSSGPVAAVPGAPSLANRLMEDLLNDATRPLGVSYREQDVDDGTLSLEAALQSAAGAVGRGVPVPIALGPAPGSHQRLALLLQTAMAGSKRTWQLYDPFSGELFWASEGDLLGRAELPFAIKTNRRITRIALPQQKAVSL